MSFRHRSIRFFISSTFADMESERNAIASIMARLHSEYSRIGWSVDYIDLRWGVSREASADNNTMRICLAELKRCRELSPRPNFIFLIGDRYGWIPLNEMLYPAEWNEIYKFAGDKERKALKVAYKFDSNCMPGGIYLLQHVDDNSIVESLDNLFNRYYSERSSATEQEISEGIFKVADAGEHVVGYIRELRTVPECLKSIYFDEKPSLKFSLDKLKKRLEEYLPDENIFHSGVIDYNTYSGQRSITLAQVLFGRDIDYNANSGESYIAKFEAEMEKRIRRVIEREIQAHAMPQSEYLHRYYIDYALTHSQYFYGRRRELEQLKSYLLSEGVQYPLLIPGNPGLGKTAFMSEGIRMALQWQDTVVEPRFIGAGGGIFNFSDLVVSVFNALYPYFSPEGRNRYPHPIDSYEADIFKLNGYSDDTWLHKLDGLLLPGKYLLFIDAADQLDSSNDLLNLLNGLSTGAHQNPYGSAPDVYNKFRNLRVVVSVAVTDGKIGPYGIDRFYTLKFDPIGKEGKYAFIQGQLKSRGRQLSDSQLHRLNETLAGCDDRGIYLDLIAKYLGSLPSYVNVDKIPADFPSAARWILDLMEKGNAHNRSLLRKFLAVVATSTNGLDMHSINGILARDADLVSELIRDSFHDFTANDAKGMLPPILLSRLYYDLDGIFVTTRSSALGDGIVIRHREVLKAVSEWLGPGLLRHARELQYKYFHDAWREGNLYAINDIVKVTCETQPGEAAALELATVLSDVDYLTQKINISPKYELIKEFDSLIFLCEEVDYLRERIPAFRRFAALLDSLPNRIDREVFLAWCQNMPVDCFFSNQLSHPCPDNILVDRLKDFDFSKAIAGNADRVTYSFSGSEPPYFSLRYTYSSKDDGNGTVLLQEDRLDHSVLEMSLLGHQKECRFFPFPLHNVVVAVRPTEVVAYNLKSGEEMFTLSELSVRLLPRYSVGSISPSGRFITVDTVVITEDDKRDNLLILIDLHEDYPVRCYPKGSSVKFSKSEDFLWVTYGSDTIIRWNVADGEGVTLKYHNPAFPDPKGTAPRNPYFEVFDAVDNMAVFGREYDSGTQRYEYHHTVVTINGERYSYLNIPQRAYFSDDEKFLYVAGDGNRTLEVFPVAACDFPLMQYPFPFDRVSYRYDKVLFCPLSHNTAMYDLEQCMSGGLHYFPITYEISCSGFSVSQDGRTICVSNFRSNLRRCVVIYRYEDGSGWSKMFLDHNLPDPYCGLDSSCISPSGAVIACAGGGNGNQCWLKIIRVRDNKTLFEMTVPNPIATIKFSADGNVVVCADAVDLSRPVTPDLKFRHLTFKADYSEASVVETAIPVVGRRGSIMGYRGFDLLPDNRTVRYDGLIFDVLENRLVTSNPLPVSNYYYHTYGYVHGNKEIRIHAKGGLIISYGSGRIEILDLRTGSRVGAGCDDTPIALSPDGSWMLMRTPDCKTYRTDLSMRYKIMLKESFPENVINAIFHPRKKGFYAITRDSAIYFCNMEGEVLARALAPGIHDAKVSSEGLIVLREGCQVSLFAPARSIIDSLPSWELDDEIMCELFRRML